MPKTVKWAPLRANKTTWSTVSSGIFGNNQCTSGPMMREERRAEFSSLDAAKIRPNQSRITSQYFRNTRSLDTAHSKQGSLQRGNPKRLGKPAGFESTALRQAFRGCLWL